eukprot:CAMPEP_0113953462 /NCGR_PEP_ID=MMETSP1339-20121228/90988_1 /TAXON_ID=94617 /ORGANISM="Fibrocapsa japonica" /LENGTH=52 /DNA_ID=CAMNT_0000962193 /DNA_START=410 /DNA_END=568 /DNA_ORIENTATION=+ /assembly_acc=CAM_ASM_000762
MKILDRADQQVGHHYVPVPQLGIFQDVIDGQRQMLHAFVMMESFLLLPPNEI